MTTLTEMPKYEAYKNSGIEWLGEIPEHWTVKKVFHYFYAKKGSNAAVLTKEYCGKNQGIYPVFSGQTENNGVMGEINSYEFDFSENGCLFSTTVGAKAMTVRYLKCKFSLSQNCMIIISRDKQNISTNYCFYLFQPMFAFFRNQIPDHMQASFRMEDLYQYRFVIPSLHEQTAIANFLDEKNTKIDEAIAIKEKQIELLKERKQIIIQLAVTQGLDPTVPMKDSGVEWIGQIPAHWDVKKLKYLLTEPLKYGANESGIEYQKDLPRYIRITDFSGEGKLNEDKKLSLSWDKGRNYLLKDGDILLARSGATVGKSYQFKSAMSDEAFCCFAGYLIKVSTDDDKILSNYLNVYLNSDCFLAWKNSIFNKATIENIGADKYATFPVILPNIKEQLDILNTIQTKFEPIDIVLNFQLKQIERLKEYKTTLINSAVTGKIKVV